METYNIQYLVDNPADFDKLKSELKKLIHDDFSSRHNKCTIIVNDEKYEITLGQLFLNVLLLSMFKGSKMVITKDDMILSDAISGGDIERYLNHILARIKIDGVDFNRYRSSVYDFLNEASDISSETNKQKGHTIDYLDFIDAEIEDPEVETLFSAKDLPKNAPFNEIEKCFGKHGSEIEKYFNSHPNRNLSPFTRSKTGINIKQMTQTLGFVGLKPDFSGSVIPHVVTGNFIHGLKSIEDYYISAKGARLALSTNYKMVRVSGYLTRKLSLLMVDTWHDSNLLDCGTKHYVEYTIDNKKKLSMINGRNYYDLINGQPDTTLKTIDPTDESLIGKTIALRSPVTCIGNKKGGHICATCYGRALSEINKNLNTGLVAVLLLTNVLTQTLLSAKHLLATNTDKVEWGEDFEEAFVINMDSIYFNDDTKVELTFQYPTDDNYDEDTESYVYNEFDIKFVDDKKLIHYVSPTPVYLKETEIPKKTEDETSFKIQSAVFGGQKEILKYVPHNNMLTKSLQNILDLIESSDHLGIEDYNEFVNTFANLLIENNMSSIDSVHAEMISAKLISDADSTSCEPLDWSQDIIKPYKINRVSKMILNSPLSTALSFERLSDQLSNINTYLKNEKSIMDHLFN